MLRYSRGAAVMKTSRGKPMQNVGSIRALLVTLSVAVCIATLMGCGQTLRKKAGAGDAAARFNLGLMYAKGERVPEDYSEAVK